MLVECGFARVEVTSSGAEFTFRPALGRIAALGSPAHIVELYADLHGPDAPRHAAYVLACLCDQEDPTPLIGWHEDGTWHDGEQPPVERVILARHLMQHGICGKSRPGTENSGGKFSPTFDAAEWVALARVHLGMSEADAEALSMTELQRLLELKFPQAAGRNVPSREEYDAAMEHFDELARQRGAMKQPGGAQ